MSSRPATPVGKSCERAIAIWENTLGKQHPAYGEGVAELAAICSQMGRRTEAETPWLQSLAILENRLGAGHATVLRVLHAYAGFLERSGQKHAAKEIRRQIASARASTAVSPERYTVDYREMMRR